MPGSWSRVGVALLVGALLAGVTLAAIDARAAVDDATDRRGGIASSLGRAQSALHQLVHAHVGVAGEDGGSDHAASLAAAVAALEAERAVVGDELLDELGAVIALDQQLATGEDAAGEAELVAAAVEATIAIDARRPSLMPSLHAPIAAANARWGVTVALAGVAWIGVLGAAVAAVAARRRRRAHDRVRAFYRSLVDTHPDRICRYRRDDLTIRYCNQAWAAAHGRPADALVGRRMDEVLVGPHLEALRTQLQRLSPGQPMASHDHDATDADGERRVTWWTDVLVDDDVVTTGRDITAHALAEEAAREAEERARFLSDHAVDVLMRVDGERRIRFVTPAVGPMLELAPDDLVGAPVSVLVDADHVEALDAAFATAMRTGAVQVLEVRATGASPEHRPWCEVRLRSVVADDASIEFHVLLRDVTEQHRLTTALAEGRALLAAVMDAATSGVVAADRDGRLVVVNRAARRLLGVDVRPGDTVAELDADGLEARRPDGGRIPSEDLALARSLRGEVVPDAEVELRPPDRPPVHLMLSGQPWYDGRGEVVGAAAVLHDVTPVRRAEARLRSILDAVEHGVLLHDDTGRVVFANRAAARLLGEDGPDAIDGLPTDAVLSDGFDAHGEPLGTAFRPVTEVLVGGRRVGPVEVGLDVDGDRRWLRLSAEPMPIGVDVARGVVVSLTDVTAEHRARRAVDESELRHRSVVEDLHEGLVVQDHDGRLVSANVAAEQILGLTADQLAGRTSTDPRWRSVDGDGRPLPGDRHPAMVTLRTGEPVDAFLMGVHRPDGELRWIRVTSRPLPVAGRPGVFTVFTDLTDVLAAQAALAESEARFRSLAEGAPLPVFIADADGRLEYGNDALAELLDRPVGKVVGEDLLRRVHADDSSEVVAGWERALDRPGGVRLEHRITGPDGAVRYVASVVRPIDSGRRVVGVIVDLTERRELEQRLAHDATHDPLTGLANRALLVDRIDQALARGSRAGQLPAVLFVDLDRFKPVNDQFGHGAGDEVLVEVASRLRGAVRSGDTVARLGGDEFVILAEPPITDTEVDLLALRLLDRIMVPVRLRHGPVVAVGASIGVAVARPDEAPAALLGRADVAVYEAKALGRGRVARAVADAGQGGVPGPLGSAG